MIVYAPTCPLNALQDSCLDEYLGRSKPAAIVVKPPIQRAQALASTSHAQQNPTARLGRLDPAILHASYLPKPQLKFKTRVDNMDSSRWIPRLKHKYNAQVPLGLNLHDETMLDGAETVEKYVCISVTCMILLLKRFADPYISIDTK